MRTELLVEPDSPQPLSHLFSLRAFFRRDLSVVLLLTLAMAGLSLYLNLHEGSSLVPREDLWQKSVDFHRAYHPFATRPLTTELMSFANRHLGVTLFAAFTVIQYSLFVLLGPLFYLFLRHVGLGRAAGLAGVVIMLGAYPMLAAFHIPLYTWDDFWQHAAALLAFILLFRHRLLASSLVFSIGIVAREPIMLYYPILLLGMLKAPSPRSVRTGAILLPLVFFLAYSAFLMDSPDPYRWHNFNKNFLDAAWAKNTAYSVLASFGFLWLTAAAAAIRLGQTLLGRSIPRLMLLGAAFTVPLTVVITLTGGLARETRLFFTPFIFVIPLSLYLAEFYGEQLKSLLRPWRLLAMAAVLALAIWGGIEFSQALFPQFQERAWPAFARAHLGINIGLALCFIGYVIYRVVRSHPAPVPTSPSGNEARRPADTDPQEECA